MPKQKLKWYPVENDREYAYAGLEVTTERAVVPHGWIYREESYICVAGIRTQRTVSLVYVPMKEPPC